MVTGTVTQEGGGGGCVAVPRESEVGVAVPVPGCCRKRMPSRRRLNCCMEGTMRLLICRLCTDNEPFACPLRFRRTYMELHLEKAHGLKLESGVLLRTHEAPSGPVLWRSGEGREAKLILEELSLPATRPDMSGLRAGAIAEKSAPWQEGRAPERRGEVTSPKLPPPLPSGAAAIPPGVSPDIAKQLAAAYRSQYAPRGDPHGPPPAPLNGHDG
jgi:hypothetical protein